MIKFAIEMDSFFTSMDGFLSAEALPRSASARRYYRIRTTHGSLIGVEGVDAAENRTFVEMSRFFRAAGQRMPEVLAVSDDSLRYVQEDLGDLRLRDCLEDKTMVLQAVRSLPHIQFAGRGFDYSRCYSTARFNGRVVDNDVNYFKYCFLKPALDCFDENALQDDFDLLKQRLLADSFDTFLYRDFQSRNIMVKDSRTWFIDFQGGYRGPVYYDICSFVYQASAGFSDFQREELIDAYFEELSVVAGYWRDNAAFPGGHVDRRKFDRAMRDFALFRCLQTLGAYGFRGLIQRKRYFIDSIPAGLKNLDCLCSDDYPFIRRLPDRLFTVNFD